MIFERLKILYKNRVIKNLSNYIAKGLITDSQAQLIIQEAGGGTEI